MADELRITITDLKKLRLCDRGTREWAGEHGIDFNAFLKNGIPADELLATGDAMAQRVVNVKRRRLEGNRGR